MDASRFSRGISVRLLTVATVLFAGCAGGPPPATATSRAQAEGAAKIVWTTPQHLLDVQRLVAEARPEGLPGFYALVRKDHTDYCWSDRNIGTLIASTKCVHSAAALHHVLKMLAAERHAMMERPQGMCTGAGSCA